MRTLLTLTFIAVFAATGWGQASLTIPSTSGKGIEVFECQSAPFEDGKEVTFYLQHVQKNSTGYFGTPSYYVHIREQKSYVMNTHELEVKLYEKSGGTYDVKFEAETSSGRKYQVEGYKMVYSPNRKTLEEVDENNYVARTISNVTAQNFFENLALLYSTGGRTSFHPHAKLYGDSGGNQYEKMMYDCLREYGVYEYRKLN